MKEEKIQWYNDLLFRYGVFVGKRYRSAEKRQFKTTIQKECMQLGIQGFSEKVDHKAKNLYFGSFLKQDIVLMCGYDTPLWTVSGDVYPLNRQRQQKNAIQTILVSLFAFFVGMTVLFLILNQFQVFASYIAYAVFVVVLTLGTLYLTMGIPLRLNVTYNSANIIATVLLAQALIEAAVVSQLSLQT